MNMGKPIANLLSAEIGPQLSRHSPRTKMLFPHRDDFKLNLT